MPDLLILDDLRARKLAKKLDLKYTGTLGVINKAKEKRIITKVKPFLERIKKEKFRLSESVINHLLKRHNEL